MATAKTRRVQAPKKRAPEPKKGGQPLWVWAALAASALAAVLVSVSLLGGGGGSPASGPIDATETLALLDGIPQDGTILGDKDAPVTVAEYADIQCPFCATFSEEGFEALVAEYVRDGVARVDFRGMAFIGEDSEEALRAALAAGRQDKLWHVVHLLYANQGGENTDWVTEDLLRRIGEAVPGLDVERMLADMGSGDVTARMGEAESMASIDGIQGTPSFTVGATGERGTLVGSGALGLEDLRPAIEAARAG